MQQNRPKYWFYLYFSFCCLCALLFAYTAQEKIIDHERFEEGLAKVEFIGNFSGQIAIAVPIVEIVISVLILVPWTRTIGLWSFLFTMCLFTIYISAVLIWANKLPCLCGGVIETLSWTAHLWLNAVIIVIAVILIRLDKSLNN